MGETRRPPGQVDRIANEQAARDAVLYEVGSRMQAIAPVLQS